MSGKENNENTIVEPHPIEPEHRKWRWWLPYLGGIVGLLALLGSLIVFIISTSIQIYDRLVYKEQVSIITFNTVTRQTFLNTGDGEVFLSHMVIRCETLHRSEGFGIFHVLKPNEFLYMPPEKGTPNRIVFATDEKADWETVIDMVRTHGEIHGYERDGKKYSLLVGFLTKDSPDLQFFKTSNNVRTLEATGDFVYFSANGGKRLTQRIPLEAVIFLEEESQQGNSRQTNSQQNGSKFTRRLTFFNLKRESACIFRCEPSCTTIRGALS